MLCKNVHSKIEQNVYSIGATYKPFDMWTTGLKLGRLKINLIAEMVIHQLINTQRDSLSWLNTR